MNKIREKIKGAKVLIVDDIVENIQVLGSILDSHDFEVAMAMNGQEALESVAEDKPDIILLDVNMPIMDGYETCKALKKDPATRDIPIIFLTAKAEEEDVINGLEIGAVDYVLKPFRAKELMRRLEVHLDLYFSHRDLENTIEDKNKLFSIIAHDMRSPFNALIGFSNLLMVDGAVNEEQKNAFIKIINETSKDGLSLLENLLLWARAQTGRMEFKKEKLQLLAVIQEVLKLLTHSATEKQIKLEVAIEEGIVVLFDEDALRTIIRNVVSNAIKFTPKEGCVTLKALQAGPRNVELVISDNGMGMPQSVLDELFKPSKLKTRRGTEDEKGSGLGMLLVNDFIEKNDASIKVESKEGKGTAIHLFLPSN